MIFHHYIHYSIIWLVVTFFFFSISFHGCVAAATAIAPAAACLPPTELPAPQGVHAAVVTGRAIGVATALRA